MAFITPFVEYFLFAVCLSILLGSIYITLKLRFVQVRVLPELFRLLNPFAAKPKEEEGTHTVSPRLALITAMSTTIGLSTIVGPTIAISLGGPGAILGYILSSFFGSATTYTEVHLSILHRKRLPSGEVMGGPMQYIKNLISPFAAQWYAVGCFLLMVVWSGAQANQLTAIFDSPIVGPFRIPLYVSGAITAIAIFFTLTGGIKRVAALSAKLVPSMFCFYVSSCLWIIFANTDRLGEVTGLMFSSLFSPVEFSVGVVVGGVMGALRWGIFKGIQASEAGVGTQSIPHSMAETTDSVMQGKLAMVSTYMSGLVCLLSGYVALLTGTWLDPELKMGISMVAASFEMYFSSLGVFIISICSILFAFGTILGNSYNGSQCFKYLSKGKGITAYYAFASLMVFLGSVSDPKFVWSMIDLVLAVMVIPHLGALLLHVYRDSEGMLKDLEQSKEKETEQAILVQS